MKKQINPTIKAHLLRSAFYLLLVLAVCGIPFALAQRQTSRHSVAKPTAVANVYPQQVALPDSGAISAQSRVPKVPRIGQSQLPTTLNIAAAAPAIPVPVNLQLPDAPAVVLYDQMDHPAPTPSGVNSQDFGPSSLHVFDDFTADDFVVPGGQTWNVTEVDVAGEYSNGAAASFNVFFYTDSATLPGTLVATRLANPYSNEANAIITLTTPVTLTEGTYWVSVQARQDLGQWFWDTRLIISNSGAAWQNPGGGLGVGCLTWDRTTTCVGAGYPDQLFRLLGTLDVATPSPTPTCTPGAKIYNIGGFDAVGQPTNTTRIYDIATNTWSTSAPMPAALSEMATAYFNGKIYVAGGYDGTSVPVNTLYIYDIASNSWTTGAPMLAGQFAPGFGIINGKLYIACGDDGTGQVTTLEIYDIASNTWDFGPAAATPVTGPGSAAYQGKLYLFGGGFPTPLSTGQFYDSGTNTWDSVFFNMNVPRLWFYCAAVDDTSIVAPGGSTNPTNAINDNEQFTSSWVTKAPLPYNARGSFAVSDGTFVYIGGGYDSTTVHSDLLRYDPVANTFTPLASSPDAHYLSQAVLVT